MIAFAIGFIVPFIYGIFLSFCKFTTVTDWKWIGLENYTRIFVVNGKLDTTFLHSLWYTALFTIVTMLIINVVAFAIALLLTKGLKGTNLLRRFHHLNILQTFLHPHIYLSSLIHSLLCSFHFDFITNDVFSP